MSNDTSGSKPVTDSDPDGVSAHLPPGWRPNRRELLTLAGAGVAGASLARFDDISDALGLLTGGPRIETPVEAGGMEHDAALALVPDEAVTHRAVRSGSWKDGGIWKGGSPPGDSARVRIEEGVTVTVDHRETARLKTVRVDGALRFAHETDTELQVETLVTTPGSVLQIGTEDRPIDAANTARLTFVDLGPLDENWDANRVSKGLLAMGAVRIHGTAKSGWHSLASAPTAGDEQLTLAEEPTGWGTGDRIVVPGTNPDANEDEEAVVRSVDGPTVTLDRALEHDHTPPREDLDSYALNLDRNVRIESETEDVPRRGHTMFMSQAVDVRYAGLYDLGRTDKSYAFTNPDHGKPPEDVPPNPKARYALHFHKTGIDADSPNTVEGCAVWGSPGWGIVNHHSHVDVTDSVTYDVFGAGFVAEGGNERGSFRGNFALRSTGSGEFIDSREFDSDRDADPGEVDDFGHGGHGFWFQGPTVAVEGNVAAGHRYYAFVFWNRPLVDRELRPGEEIDRVRGTVANYPLEYVDGQQPLKESDHVTDGKVSSAYVHLQSFADNTAFASAGGLDISRHMFGWDHTRVDEWSVVDGFTAYNIGSFTTHWGKEVDPDRGNRRGGNSAITVRYSHNLRIQDATLVSGDGRDGVGINRNVPYPFHVSIEDSDVEGFERGGHVTSRGITRCRDCRFANTRNLVVDEFDSHPDQRIKLSNLTFERGKQGNLTLSLPEFDDISADELFADDASLTLDGRTVYFDEQAPDHVPVPSQQALNDLGGNGTIREWTGEAASAIVGKTNRELHQQYGIAVRGAVVPDSASRSRQVSGGSLGPSDGRPPETIWLDAERGALESPWVVEESPSAAGNRYITTHGVEAHDEPTESGHATYEFEAASGEYVVSGRVRAPSGDADSFWIRIDGGKWVRWDHMRTRRGWEWETVPDDESRDEPHRFQLSGGSHTLDVAFREDETKLDRILVTQRDWEPVLYGGPSSNV